ncbi:MAG: type II secretion system protein [Longimicrobiales bacterium]|nr:type II secretion system protein [Longimicrobiales bacterium]
MNDRRGFTLIEMIIVIALGAILTSIAIASFSNVQQGAAMDQSRRVLWSMHARARAQAIENGQNVELRISGPGDSVAVVRNDTILESLHVEEEFGIDLAITGDEVRLCFGPNGIADLGCNSFTSLISGSLRSTAGDTFFFFLFPAGGIIES